MLLPAQFPSSTSRWRRARSTDPFSRARRGDLRFHGARPPVSWRSAMTVLRSIPAPAEALLGSNALAHVITRNPDTTPQVSVVWCAARGDQVLFVTEGSSSKVRNIHRDPS